jgi:hypothetical protein
MERPTRRGLVALGAAAALGGLLGRSSGAEAASAAQDVKILNFLLLLEYLQADFYRRAVASGSLSGEPLQFAQTVGAQEEKHVSFLRSTLGSYAAASPRFQFGEAFAGPRFRTTALAIEDLGTAAYLGQSANLTPVSIGAAASITAVEARHAAWIRDLVGVLPAPAAADTAASPAEVAAQLRKLGITITR